MRRSRRRPRATLALLAGVARAAAAAYEADGGLAVTKMRSRRRVVTHSSFASAAA
jgi:hypothetical protein